MKISLKEKLFMFLRKSPVKQIQKAGDLLEQIDFPVKLMELEAHTLAGGNILSVAKAAEQLKNNNIDFELIKLQAIDLAGKDLTKVVKLWIENRSKPRPELDKMIWES